MATIEIRATSPEHARKIAAEMRKHWAVISATSSGFLVVVETSSRQAKGSVANALRQLKVSFEISSSKLAPQVGSTPAVSVSPQIPVNGSEGVPQSHKVGRGGTRKGGRRSSRPPAAEFLQSLRERGVEGTASHYGVSTLTVKNPWVKAVPGAKALIPDGRKTRWKRARAI